MQFVLFTSFSEIIFHLIHMIGISKEIYSVLFCLKKLLGESFHPPLHEGGIIIHVKAPYTHKGLFQKLANQISFQIHQASRIDTDPTLVRRGSFKLNSCFPLIFERAIVTNTSTIF